MNVEQKIVPPILSAMGMFARLPVTVVMVLIQLVLKTSVPAVSRG